jgi:hypothetical protein
LTTFKGLALFASGPHSFTIAREGQLLVSEAFDTPPAPGSRYLGLLELRIDIGGRLIAADESALWSLRDAITAQLLHPPAPGLLVDPRGRAFADMSLVRFAPRGPAQRGRMHSLAYTARFVRFRQYPQDQTEAPSDHTHGA